MPEYTTEWINQNRYRRYPFIEDTVLEDGTAVMRLTDDCVVDAYFIAYNTALPNLRLHSVAVDGGGVSVTFTFRAGVASEYAIIVPGSVETTYEGTVRVTAGGLLSVLLRVMFAEGVAELASNPVYQGNTYTFTDALLEPCVAVKQWNNRVASVNAKTEEVYFGDGVNTRITLAPDLNVLRVTAAIGEGLGISCEPAAGGAADCSEAIYYINGRHPDWLGRFGLRGGGGIMIEADPANHKLTIKTAVDKRRPKCRDPRDI